MKTLWTNEYISDLSTEAEIQISSVVPCIFVRFPLNVVLGTGIYDFTSLTDTPVAQRLTGIIRITWQGWTVHPQFQDQLRNVVVPLQPGNGDVTSSRPLLYMKVGYGMDKVKFFPAPNATIAYDSTDVNSKTSVRNNVIVSGWRIADPTGTTYRIPGYVRETLVRYYVLARAYKKEGKGQNLEASAYYEAQYTVLLARFKIIISQLFTCRTNSVKSQFEDYFGRKPPRPRLPSNFGEEIY